MQNDTHRFCTSFITCQVAYFGLQTVVKSWIEHNIPGKSLLLLKWCCKAIISINMQVITINLKLYIWYFKEILLYFKGVEFHPE